MEEKYTMENEEIELEIVDLTEEENDADDEFYDDVTDDRASEPYFYAIGSVVFGAISIVTALFALLFALINTNLLPITVAAVAVAFAVVGLIWALKCKFAIPASLSEGYAKVGKIVSIVALAFATCILAYTVIAFIVALITAIIVISVYAILYFLSILAMLFGY